MLVGKRATILCVAAQTELIHVRRPQIVARRATVRIVAIGTTHFSFAQRMMIGHADLRAFSLVTLQASIVRLPAGLHHGFGFGDQILHIAYAAGSHHIHKSCTWRASFCTVIVGLMAVNAANLVGSVRTCHPVANSFISRMTTQTHAVCVGSRALTERDDLGNITATLHVQAAGTVALLAFDALLGMKGVPEVFRDVGVAGGAGFRAHRSRALNLDVLPIRGDRVFGFLGCDAWKTEDHN